MTQVRASGPMPYFLLKTCALIAVLLVFISACSTRIQYGRSTRPGEMPDSMRAPFAYESVSQVTVNRELLEENRFYTLEHATIDSTIDSTSDLASQKSPRRETIVIEQYLNTDPNAPGIVVLPIYGGHYEVAQYFSRYFAKNGYSAFIVHREDKYKERACTNSDESMVRMVQRQKQAVDWIAHDDAKLGVFGVSAGGMKATMLASLDKRFDAAVIALAGADIALICAESEEGRIVKEREAVMGEEKLTIAQFRDYVERNTKLKLADYAGYLDPSQTLQIIAARDKTVPTEAQMKLYDALGKPKMHKMQAGHRSSLLYLLYIRSKSLQFFNEQLKTAG